MTDELSTALHLARVPTDLSRITLLVACGDRRARGALKRELADHGYHVLTTRSAEETLRAIDSQQPHVVLLDTSLPDADAALLADQLKGDDALGFLPIIVLADPAQNGHATGPACQADVVLPRTVASTDLLTWVDSLLRIRGQFDRLLYENRKLATESQSANWLKTEIIDTVSHELRTPLLQVKSAVYLLSEDIAEDNQRDQAMLAHMATQAVARLESVVESMRQLAQTYDIRFGMVSVEEAAALAMRYLERNWASRFALERIDLQIDPDLPPVLADKRAVGRLLQLLLDNALKFSPGDTPITLRADLFAPDRVWIGVEDRGIGIPSEEHERIFQAFYQVDRSPARRYGGAGTGLALALLLARGINTTIQLESTPGEGSTFWFLLPVVGPDDLLADPD